MTTRKRRNDRNHLIYLITCAVTDEQYIGVTVMKGAAKKKTLKQRWSGHVYKAEKLQEIWGLSAAIREHGSDNFSMDLLEVIRGKKDAFAREAYLINKYKTQLNTRKKQ